MTATRTRRALNRVAALIEPLQDGCRCELRTEPITQLRVNAGSLILSIMEDDWSPDRFVLVRVSQNGDFLANRLTPFDIVRKVAALLNQDEGNG
jgi:hypothetical protein